MGHYGISDAQTGQEITRVTESLRLDGLLIVTSSDRTQGTMRTLDAQTAKEIARVTDSATDSVVLGRVSPDGRRILMASAYGPTADIYDAQTGEQIAWVTHDESVSSVAFSSDGQQLLTASADKTARVWDIELTTRYGSKLIALVCDQKLVGTRWLTASDVAAVPVLAGRQGHDVCGGNPLVDQFIRWLRRSR